MKLQLPKSNFLKSLSFVQNIVESKGTIPILANVLLEAKQGRLNLSATARASIGVYNTKEDIDVLCKAISNCINVFDLK